MLPEPDLPAPRIFTPARASPLVLSVPHSGRDCPPWLARQAAGGTRAILALADPYVDRLVAPLVEAGHGAVVAQAPRAALDPNRDPAEKVPALHPEAPAPPPMSKAARGLGIVIARNAAGKPLWKTPLATEAFERRVAVGWRAYHEALSAMIEEARARFGAAVLLDCHSMPPRRRGLPRIVLGDRDGASAAPFVAAAATRVIEAAGLEAGLNHPYAGGEIVRRHGQPGMDVHALQLEIDRSLYLDRALRVPGSGMARITRLVSAVAASLEAAVLEGRARAAE
ncbi:N-formylglutamate amidohydrolase [Sphingomicrobium aestuariivivum]|uniref:N-formylglutamate amidohydrolase n=1 Tax=Sphingomicrobium aestuariivivum TaxID=1582356 RepID=UPI001FD656A6|nr:N-formylglutamate amidohydrolase [Sphingomicrobium aestuariivivum]MCJ8191814.1 N-formylglutamate amidohydrolase [Sphingomicrobium aestuariivivum]